MRGGRKSFGRRAHRLVGALSAGSVAGAADQSAPTLRKARTRGRARLCVLQVRRRQRLGDRGAHKVGVGPGKGRGGAAVKDRFAVNGAAGAGRPPGGVRGDLHEQLGSRSRPHGFFGAMDWPLPRGHPPAALRPHSDRRALRELEKRGKTQTSGRRTTVYRVSQPALPSISASPNLPKPGRV